MNRAILSIALILSITTSAYAAVTDTDGDGLSDSFEIGLRTLTNNTDDLGAAIDETVSNTYNDTDGDGIPDIVEINILFTSPTTNDSSALNYVTDLNGEGTGTIDNLSGQWDGCRYTSTVSECDSVLNVAEFNATSIMHSSTGQLVVYTAIDGFTNTASYNPATNQFTGSVQLDGPLKSFTVTYDDVDTMTGTFTTNGFTENFIMKRRSQLTFTENMSGIFGVQDVLLDNNLDADTTVLNPLSNAVQQVASGVDAEMYFNEFPAEGPIQGFIAPSVGQVAYIGGGSRSGIDLDNDGAADDTATYASYIGVMTLQAPVNKVGGFFRASGVEGNYVDFNSDGSLEIANENEDASYGTAIAPRLSSYTLNKISGANTVFNAMNVPMSATQISLSGGLNVDVVGGSSGKTLDEMVSIRTRLNPFTDSWDEASVVVGLSGSGKQNIAKVGTFSARSNYDDSPAAKLANLAPSGSYTYSFTDSDSSPNAVGSYTQPGSLVDPVNPDGVRINGSLLKPGVPRNTINGLAFDTSVSNTISWDPVAGATQYDLQFSIRSSEQFSEYQSVFRFTTGTSVTIPANTLQSGVGYDMTITTRNGTSNRSRSTEYRFNSTTKTTGLNLTSIAEGANVAGYNAASGGVNFQALLRPGDGSKDIGYILLHGRCNGPEKVVVSTLRRSLAYSGAATISIANPAPNPDINNDCGAFGSYSDYVNSVNGSDYVMTEAYARVRTAMKYLKDNEGVNRVVLVGFSLGSRLAAAAANHADDTVANPVPVVGLILAGGRSGGGAALLDTTNTIAGVTVPVLDIHMVADDKAFTTAAARQTAFGGSSYTIDAVATVDSWTVVNNLPENDKFRHQFMGYEDVLRSKVKSWVTSTDLSIPSTTNPANDHNGDGKSDVMVRHTDGRWFYFPMNGRSVIVAQQGIAGITTNNSWQYQGSGDYNGDGNADILVRHSDGRWFYFPMNGRGVITAQQGIAGITTNNSWQYQGSGDMNGDGKDDVLVRHTDGRWFYFPMNGRAVITAQQGIAGLTNNTAWQFAGMGDLNGDGKDDVLVRHTDGRWFYFPMNGRTAIVAQQGIAGITTNTAWQFAGMGDLNGDSKDDVLVRHTDGRWFYFPMNGRSVIVAQQGIAGITTNNAWQFASMGDQNGDGKDDVMVRHTDGRWFYFPMNGRTAIVAQQGIAGITTNTAWGVLP